MDETSIDKHISAMFDAEIIAVDTETTGLRVADGTDYLMGISVAYRLGPLGIMSAYFPFRHEAENLDRSVLTKLSTVFNNRPLVFHNLKFDLHSLHTIGIELNPTAKLFDTMNMAHMVNEELPSKGLDYLAQKYLNENKTTAVKNWADVWGWSTVPVGLMDPYACKDAELTLKLFELLWPEMKRQELHTLWPTERRFTRLLVDMEQRGVLINEDFAADKIAEGEEIMARIEKHLGWSPTSSLDLEKFLLTDLGLPVHHVSEKTGKPSFNSEAMKFYDEQLSFTNRTEAKLVLVYRGWQKAVSSLYRPALGLRSADGRVRCNFKQHGTKTGRLACAEPNLQQVPRKSDKPWNGDSKRTFLASPGRELWGYDYSQLEFRLATAYGRVPWLMEVFNDEKRDVFSELAQRIGEQRQSAKTYVYCTMYGGGKAKVAATLGKALPDIESNYDLFKTSIEGINEASRVAQRRAKTEGYVRMWTGRRRHFPYEEGHHKAFNSVLQGGGAEVVKRAMIMIDSDERIDKSRCAIVLQVHDEIVFDMDPSYRKEVEPIIMHHMVNFPEFGIRFAVERRNWTTGEEPE